MRKIVVIVVATLAVLTVGGVSAIWAYGRTLDHNLRRTDAFAGLSGDRPTETVSGAMNILLLGSDSRDPDSTTDSRTDTIMVVHVDADHKHAYAISIPRDTWVDVPGHSMAKINAAYAWGGTPLAVQTVENFTGRSPRATTTSTVPRRWTTSASASSSPTATSPGHGTSRSSSPT